MNSSIVAQRMGVGGSGRRFDSLRSWNNFAVHLRTIFSFVPSHRCVDALPISGVVLIRQFAAREEVIVLVESVQHADDEVDTVSGDGKDAGSGAVKVGFYVLHLGTENRQIVINPINYGLIMF